MKLIPLKLTVILVFGFLALMGCSSDGQADNAAASKTNEQQFVLGKHYEEIFPEMNTNAAEGKVEVIELFWLGCPHCYSLEPAMKEYKKSMPDYVVFDQVPAALNPAWNFHAKVYYTARILDPKNTKNLLDKLFAEIHDHKNPLNTPAKVKEFFAQQGYSESQFNNAFNSMALNAAMSNATTISSSSQASSVPTVIINGKYRTSPYMAGNEQNLVKIINMLTTTEKNES